MDLRDYPSKRNNDNNKKYRERERLLHVIYIDLLFLVRVQKKRARLCCHSFYHIQGFFCRSCGRQMSSKEGSWQPHIALVHTQNCSCLMTKKKRIHTESSICKQTKTNIMCKWHMAKRNSVYTHTNIGTYTTSQYGKPTILFSKILWQ